MAQGSPPATASLDARLAPRAERLAYAAIVALALFVRVAFVLQMRRSPYFDDPQLDAGFFVGWGREVAGGATWPEGAFPRAPLYAWWLGALFRLLGDGLLLPRLLQALLGAASVGLVGLLARTLVSRAAGLAAALLAALCWPLTYYDAELVREPLFVFLVLAALALAARGVQRGGVRAWAGAALVLGLAALVRPQVLAPALGVLAWALATRRLRAPAALACAALAFAPVLPVTLHNAASGAGFVLVSAEAGQALWIGNNPAADGVTATAPGTRRGFVEQQEDARAIAEREAGHALTAAEVSAHWRARALRWIADEPLAALRLYTRKLALLVSGWELGANPEEPRFFAERFAPVVRALPVGFGLLFALAVPGAVHALRRRPQTWLVAVFALTYAATVLAVLVGSRHRLPLLPLLAVLAGAGVAGGLELALARSVRPLALGALAAALAFAATRAHPWPVEASRANGLAWLGMAAVRSGDVLGGLQLLDESIAARADLPDVHRARGAALAKLGRTGEARAAFAEAVRLAPEDVDALDGLGELELRLGRASEARALAERSIAAVPSAARGWALRGRARYELGDASGAAEDLRAALARQPDYALAAYSLGVVARESGRADEALAAFERAAAARAPADGALVRAAQAEVVRLLRAAGRLEEAEQWERRARERFPEPGPAPDRLKGPSGR